MPEISTLKKSGCNQREIAEIIGTSQSTVSRELARNTGEREYRHRQAQGRTDRRRTESARASRMTPKMIEVIESKLRVEWNPEQISGWLLNDQERLIIPVAFQVATLLAAFAHPDHLLLVASRGFAYLLPSSNLKCFGYSYESIYLHTWANKQAGGDLYMHLHRQGKKYDKRRNGKSTRGQIKNRVSIDDRPEIIDDK
ncbi:MAG: helix-turn-helix domain-containing protein [Candidatus Endonucleobacter sp. (ex Gigantidas childressi)]|nr:helix-turn-helix domain-containing protein [Candidatus Endonucleobacter sp. (ex Gigantidas childressi)]